MTAWSNMLGRLDIRLALSGLALLAAAFLAIVLVIINGSRSAALETVQRQNLSLAGNIALMQPRELIDIDGRADIALMQALAESVMKINPALEVYLLDAQGRVVAHALERRAPIKAVVDIDAVTQLAIPSIEPPRLPVFGNDPMRPGRQAIFSATALGHGGTPDGYLYLVLDGRKPVAASAGNATDTVQLLLISIGAIGLGLAIAFVWVLSRLTRPLRQLADRLHTPAASTTLAPPIGGSREVRALDAAIQTMQHRITEQLKALRIQDGDRRELISNVSHDLRTPLTIARGYIESVLVDHETSTGGLQTRPLRQTLHQLRRLERRISDLFDLSQLDSDRPPLTHERFVVAELVQDVFDGYRLTAGQRGIAVSFDPGPAPTTEIIADIALVERAVQNLLDNAFAHTPDGGSVRAGIAVAGHQNTVRVIITNTGCGIQAADLPHVFKRYWRSATKQSESGTSGTGLGLAIVKRIAEHHDGRVGVESAPGGATAFWLELALIPSRAEAGHVAIT